MPFRIPCWVMVTYPGSSFPSRRTIGRLIKLRETENFMCLNPWISERLWDADGQLDAEFRQKDEGVYYGAALDVQIIPDDMADKYRMALVRQNLVAKSQELVRARMSDIDAVAAGTTEQNMPQEFAATLSAMFIHALADIDEAAIADKFLDDIADAFSAYHAKRRLFGMPLTEDR